MIKNSGTNPGQSYKPWAKNLVSKIKGQARVTSYYTRLYLGRIVIWLLEPALDWYLDPINRDLNNLQNQVDTLDGNVCDIQADVGHLQGSMAEMEGGI